MKIQSSVGGIKLVTGLGTGQCGTGDKRCGFRSGTVGPEFGTNYCCPSPLTRAARAIAKSSGQAGRENTDGP